MNEFTPEEQFDTSVLLEGREPILGEDNEIIGFFDEELPYNDPAEVADDYFSDPAVLAARCSSLMDEVEAEGGAHSSEEGDARMDEIARIATYLSYFYPDLLDPRFG